MQMSSQNLNSTTQTFEVPAEARGQRLDQFLVANLEEVSRARVQLLIDQDGVRVDDRAQKASFKLRGGESIAVTGEARPEPLKAQAEDIPLDVIFEDENLAVVNKPAGMMVHAGAGATDDERSRGTLVNALLFRFQKLSSTGGDLRPGIVHRLDKETSGLIVVAKNDRTHLKLAKMFSDRKMKKCYIALVEGRLERDRGTIDAPIGRDIQRRTRMSTRVSEETARHAVSHYTVLKRLETRFGPFTLVEVRIETGRTHQIRVHMSSIGNPVVGDTLYGAAGQLTEQTPPGSPAARRRNFPLERIMIGRNFLHAARLEFTHPITNKPMELEAPLPELLTEILSRLEAAVTNR